MSLEKIEVIRLNIGDTDTTNCDLTDNQINYALSLFPSPDPYSDALQTWNATIQCLIWLKGKFANSGFRSRERVGNVEIDNYGSERYKNICDLLDFYKANPPVDADSNSVIAAFKFAEDQKPRIKIGWQDDCLPPEDEDLTDNRTSIF